MAMRTVELGRRLGQDPPAKLLAKDNQQCIASARRHSILILLVGTFTAQLALEESGRRNAAALYGYLAKVVVAAEAVREAEAPQRKGDSVQGIEALEASSDWTEMFAVMMGPERGVERLWFDDEDELFATRADPANECNLTVWGLGQASVGAMPDRVAVAVMRPSIWERMDEYDADPSRTFVLEFPLACAPVIELKHVVVVADYGEAGDGLAIVLDDQGYRDLGVLWTRYVSIERMVRESSPEFRENWRAQHAERLSPAQLERLGDRGYPFLRALDVHYVKNAIVRAAWVRVGRSYALDEWRTAVRAILDDATDRTGIWGFRIDRRVAVLAAPVVMLALCCAFWYRVRRIDPAKDIRSEPWMALGRCGWIERAIAWFLALGTFAAVCCVAWAMGVYEWSDRPSVPDELRLRIAAGAGMRWWDYLWWVARRADFWGSSAVGVAVCLLVSAWWHVHRVARAGGEAGR